VVEVDERRENMTILVHWWWLGVEHRERENEGAEVGDDSKHWSNDTCPD
jgi:hypothetical protein